MDLQDGGIGGSVCYPDTFPNGFVEYCTSHGIPAESFQQLDEARQRRYFRLRELGSAVPPEMAAGAKPVPWLPCNAHWIPRHGDALMPLSSSESYRRGDICCMDAASMASVVALQIEKGDAVLDLCCCPGMKLLLAADALRACADPTGVTPSVVGVDVSLDRLLVARALVRKHGATDMASLICCDGTKFDQTALRDLASQCDISDASLERRVSNYKKFLVRQAKRVRESEEESADRTSSSGGVWVLRAPRLCSAQLFQKVLVDAECTHDGSISHLDLCDSSASGALGGITNQQRMARMNIADMGCLHSLQLALLERGFEWLAPAGRLVYSTCSFSRFQNEDVVETFLRRVNADGRLRCRCVEPFPVWPAASDTHQRVSPLLRMTADMQEAMRDVCSITRGVVVIPASAENNLEVDLITAKFFPRNSLTSFQFLVVIEKL